MNRLVQGMRELIQPTVGPGIRIVVADAAEVWPALVDASRLEKRRFS